MILLEEAIARFNRAAHPYGTGVSTWRRVNKPGRLLAEIEQEIAPLTIPVELRAFWHRYNPGSINPPALEGFIPLDYVAEQRRLDHPPAPAVLLPIADWSHSRVWMELASEHHPGGRIFHSYHDETEVSLWAFGLSGLFDLMSFAFERDLIDDRRGQLHEHHFEIVVRKHLDELVSEHAPRRFEAVDRSQFSVHWQQAEGLPIDHFTLRGATHTVATLREEREHSTPIVATLQGRFELEVGGGPIHGCIGTFTDVSGEMQLFIPQPAAVLGSVGTDGEVEIDVLAVAPNGRDRDSLSARRELEHAVAAGWVVSERDLFRRLMRQMRQLDTSIVATALRPIR